MTVSLLLFILLVISLLVYLGTRGSSTDRFAASADHYHWIVRSLAASLAVSALLATAVGTWRGSGLPKGFRPISVTIPSKSPQPLPEGKSNTLGLGIAKLIGTVIVARWEEGRFIPVAGESRVCNLESSQPWRLHFSGCWQNSSYDVLMNFNQFFHQGTALQPQGGVTIKTQGPGWSSSRGGSQHPIGVLNMEELRNGMSIDHALLSLVPYDNGGYIYLLFHLARVDADDPLAETPAAEWLARQSTAHLNMPSDGSIRRNRYDPDMPPGIRMFAYVGPSAFLLLLAAIAGSVCFRYGWRGHAFAGLIAAMVIYAGLLDALVLQRRASVMVDSSQAESNRILAMSAMPGTFFHAKRAARLIDDAAREGKIPHAMAKSER